MGIKQELRRLARQTRPHVGMFPAVVRTWSDLTPRMRRVTLAGPQLRRYPGWLPADAVRVFVPAEGTTVDSLMSGAPPEGAGAPLSRPYTVRRHDGEMGEMDLDILLHEGSPATTWLRGLEHGAEVVVSGPRRDFHPGSDVDFHLLVGDETAIPAIAGILGELPAGTAVYCVIEVGEKSDELPMPTEAAATVHWIHRGSTPAGDTGPLAAAVSGLGLPAGLGQAWVAAESSAMREVRRFLLADGGFHREHVHAVAYWRRGVDQGELDRISTERYLAALSAGRTADDIDPEEFD